MDNRQRWKKENPNQDRTKMWSRSGKPPPGNWEPIVPTWEKKFCYEVSGVPWRKLLETKPLLHTYEYMIKWDDSAAEKAFHNAKERYWAMLNGLPYNKPLPDPNAHVDDVDWDYPVDPELYLDLDRDFVVSNDGERVLLVGDDFAKSKGLTKSGWGDEEEVSEVKLTDYYLDRLRRPPGVWVDHGGGWDNEDPWECKVKENDGSGVKVEETGNVGGDGWWSKVIENDGWGARFEEPENVGGDGWGSKVNENDGWGARVEETENVGGDGWGSKVIENDGWGARVEGTENVGGDEWGSKMNENDGWGAKVEGTENVGGDGLGSEVEETGNLGGIGWNSNSNWNQWENKANRFGNQCEYVGYKSKYNESSGRYASRYKTTSFYGNDRANNQLGNRQSGDKFGNKNNWNNNNSGYYRESRPMSRYHTTRINGDDLVNNQWERKNQYGSNRGDFGRDKRHPIN